MKHTKSMALLLVTIMLFCITSTAYAADSLTELRDSENPFNLSEEDLALLESDEPWSFVLVLNSRDEWNTIWLGKIKEKVEALGEHSRLQMQIALLRNRWRTLSLFLQKILPFYL